MQLKTNSSPPHLEQWEGFSICKNDDGIFFQNYSGYETRNESTLKLIYESIHEYGLKNFQWMLINTGDQSADRNNNGMIVDLDGHEYPCFCYSTQTKQHRFTIPDFVFDHWKQTGLNDYEDTRNWLKRNDIPTPKNKILGWRGANTNNSRSRLISFDDKKNFDCEFVVWDRKNPEKLTANNFLSFQEQIERWRYVIDMEGVGYSGRLKLLLSSPRLVFIQDRIHEEFFFPRLQPWTHYVPVRNDLLDLAENLQKIQESPNLEDEIVANQRLFSQLYLTRDYAKYLLAKIISSM